VSVAITALKLARPAQLLAVKKAVDTYGAAIEKRAYAQADALVKTCGEQVDCYIAAIRKPEHQERDAQFAGIKAGYMIGVLGNDHARDGLIAALDGVHNAAVRFVAAQTIDYLTPNGSRAVADKLDAIIARNAKSFDRDKVAGDAPLKHVMYRIRGRS
jgi:hypothetical protein